MNFGAWLRGQADRDDPIGDLARDFRRSRSRATTIAGVEANIKKYICLTPGDPVARALNAAAKEWGGR